MPLRVDQQPIRETVYTAESPLRTPSALVIDVLRGCLEGRQLGWRLFLRDVRSMYRQTLLGLFWAFLPPIANTAIWVFLRNRDVLNVGSNVAGNYMVFVLTGMVWWQAFVDAFQMPMNVVRNNTRMIARLQFPKESLLLAGLGVLLLNLGVRLIGLAGVYVYAGVSPGFHVIPALCLLVMSIVLAMGLGLLLTPIATLYHDVGRFIGAALPIWMILTPVVYAPFTDGAAAMLNWINPASPFLIAGRQLLLEGAGVFVLGVTVWGAATVPIALTGLVIFRLAVPILIERIPS